MPDNPIKSLIALVAVSPASIGNVCYDVSLHWLIFRDAMMERERESERVRKSASIDH